MPLPLEFWFEFASTYSYPAVCRVRDLAQAASVPLVWRPFLLGPLFKAQGWSDSPFNLYPKKGRYMWRDLERICAKHHLPWQKPTLFPQNGLLAARIASAAHAEKWLGDFIAAVFKANFAQRRNISQQQTLVDILEFLGEDAAGWLKKAQTEATKAYLKAQTEKAQVLHIFGAPSFIVGQELFWGSDRLEDALEWAKQAS